jgi:flagellar basal-body rod modification protein FlgD
MTMLAAPIDLSNLGSTVGSSTATKTNNATDAQASQDRFLKLLVAQLNNQDPLNPMDNAQMTTQMAQINTVSGIQQLNDTLKSMADQYSAMQGMQGTSLIGREALVEGSSLSYEGSAAKGALALDSAASSVTVDIMGTNGAVIDSVNLGALGVGQHAFEWDATGVDPSTVKGFSIRATSGGAAITATPLARVPVSSVSFKDGAMSLQLQNGQILGYDKVRAFM